MQLYYVAHTALDLPIRERFLQDISAIIATYLPVRALVRLQMKRTLLTFMWIVLGLIIVSMVILLINHAIVKARYDKIDTATNELSVKEISQIAVLYDRVAEEGNDIFPGLSDSDIDLLLFNDAYEFLVTDQAVESSWECLGWNDSLQKYIYRCPAAQSQAFAVNTNGNWVASLSTQDTLNKYVLDSMSDDLGFFSIFVPPQFFETDDAYYQGLLIHEMIHVLQANACEDRFLAASSLQGVCSIYNSDSNFTTGLQEEGEYLELALHADTREDTILYAEKFLAARLDRRTECQLTAEEIEDEKNLEWLEGTARYAEYIASSDSNCLIRKNMGDISEKVAVQSDDRYYSLGMAEALLLDKLKYDWKSEALSSDFIFEDALSLAISAA